jgi:hypothetical protein
MASERELANDITQGEHTARFAVFEQGGCSQLQL